MSYPIKDGSELNLVLIKEQDEWHRMDGNILKIQRVVKENFKDFSGGTAEVISSIENVYKWGLFRYPLKQSWYNDRVILIGDAAHPTLPFLAQGAAMAIEDSFVLASKIFEFSNSSVAFKEFRRERFPRIQRVVLASTKNAHSFILSNIISRRVFQVSLR